MLYVTHDQTEAMTLGDRIAVMRAGVLQQVGSPAHLYNHPNNLFVAGFIGSPSMNFLPGELDGDNLKIPLGTFRIPDELRQRLQAGPGGGRNGVIVGLRPEHFEDAALAGDRSEGHKFRAKIDVLESMGSEFYAYFVVEAEQVSVKGARGARPGHRRRRPRAVARREPGRRPARRREPGHTGRRGGAVVQHAAPAAVRSGLRSEPAGR